jgi:hypothetical protein
MLERSANMDVFEEYWPEQGEEEEEVETVGGSSYDCSPYRSSSLATFKDLSKRRRWAYFEDFLV